MQLDVDYELPTGGVDADYQRCLALWASVFRIGMVDVARDFAVGSKGGGALHWFWADDYYPGSFTWLCDLFDVDVDRSRTVVFNKQETLRSMRNVPSEPRKRSAS